MSIFLYEGNHCRDVQLSVCQFHGDDIRSILSGDFRNMPLSLLIPQFDSQSLIEATAFISVVILLVNLIVKLLVYVVKRKLIKDHEA